MTPWAASCAYDNDRVTHNELKSFMNSFFIHLRFHEIFYKILIAKIYQIPRENAVIKIDKNAPSDFDSCQCVTYFKL